MPLAMSTIYQFTSEEIRPLSWQERILLFIVQRDLESGRDGNVEDWYGDLRESIFMFSSGFVHFVAEIYTNTVYWPELREYGHPDEFGEGGIELPPGHLALAASREGKRRSFMLTLRRLVREGKIWAFTNQFRAIQGLGERRVSVLQLWSEQNRDRPKDIYAVSLTGSGFVEARSLNDLRRQITPWGVHKAIVEDRAFAATLTGKQ